MLQLHVGKIDERPDEIDEVLLDDAQLGAGYGLPSPGTLDAMRLFARTEALVLDPVYTGKAAEALKDRALFRLDDGSATLEASADESVFADANGILQEDALLIAQGRAQLDRFSGNLRLNVHTLIDLPTARCRYGKHLLVHVGPLAAQDAGPTFDRLFADHPPQEEITDSGDALTRGLPVRMRISLLHEDGQTVQGTVALGETRRFYPSDAALASWTALLPAGNAQIVYGVVDN